MAISLNIIDPGTIGTYTDLVSKVADWLDRDDLTAQIPDFIALLESELRDKLRTTFQQTVDLWLVTSPTYQLPSDVLALRSIYPAAKPNSGLKEVSLDALRRFADGGSLTRVYALDGRTLVFSPAPTAEKPLALEISYSRRIPPLSAAAPDNWLLNRRSDIYLWGTLHYAAAYIRDTDAMEACRQYLDAAVAQLQQASRNDAWVGPIAPNTVNQVRGARC